MPLFGLSRTDRKGGCATCSSRVLPSWLTRICSSEWPPPSRYSALISSSACATASAAIAVTVTGICSPTIAKPPPCTCDIHSKQRCACNLMTCDGRLTLENCLLATESPMWFWPQLSRWPGKGWRVIPLALVLCAWMGPRFQCGQSCWLWLYAQRGFEARPSSGLPGQKSCTLQTNFACSNSIILPIVYTCLILGR